MLPGAFGCAVANRFGEPLDDDDVDPFDLINEVETEKEKRKEKKKKTKKDEKEKKMMQKKTGQKESQKERSVDGPEPVPVHKQPQALSAEGTNGEQNQRGMTRAAAGEQRDKQEEHPQDFSLDKPFYNPESNLRGRGGSGGRRGGCGGGYSRTPDDSNQRGKREYNRHNRTGVYPEDKRGGRGPRNWGGEEEAGSEVMEATSEAPIKGDKHQITAQKENPSCVTDEDNEDIMVQVAMEMSLDEWKTMQEIKRPKAEFNIRKAEDKIPSEAKVIHQSKNMISMATVEDDVEGNFLRKSVNDITSKLEINFGNLGRPSRRGWRRGGGRRGHGGQSAKPVRAKVPLEKDELAPDLDDPEDFPALTAGN